VSWTSALADSIPDLYDRHMGPALFEPYAIEVARRLPEVSDVLEIACGTGRATRHLLARLAPTAHLLATDLNDAMLQRAAAQIRDPRVTWRVADAQALPSADASHDAVVCQFGLMFVPDKPRAVREMHRVLRPGGTALVIVWDAIARNPWSEVVYAEAVAAFQADPPTFMMTPFSMPDPVAVGALFAGFASVRVDTVELMGEAVSAAHLALGLVRGNPLVGQLTERRLDVAAIEAHLRDTLAARFGDTPCRATLSAHVVTAIA
jgi:SAM-dependent methyltransferase